MILTKESEMPFGIHKGKQMRDIPQEYLLSLLDIKMIRTTRQQPYRAVREYVEQLKKEK